MLSTLYRRVQIQLRRYQLYSRSLDRVIVLAAALFALNAYLQGFEVLLVLVRLKYHTV